MALPRVGMEAFLLLGQFQRDAKRYNKVIDGMNKSTKKSAKQIADASKEITKVTRVAAKQIVAVSKSTRVSFDTLIETLGAGGKVAGKFFSDFFTDLAKLDILWNELGQPSLDVEVFTELANKGASVEEAFRGAAKAVEVTTPKVEELAATAPKVEELSQAGISLGAVLAIVSTALGVAVVAFKAVVSIIRTAITVHSELTKAQRDLQLVMGTTSIETATWAKLTKDAGVSTSTLSRSVSFLERQLTDLRLRQIEGKESTTAFSRSLDLLGISTTDMTGNMRPADEVMQDIIQRMEEMGPSSQASALALRLFGRGAKDLLPLLFESARSIERTREQAERLGTVMTQADKEAFQKWTFATNDLNDALKGLWVVAGRQLLPTLTKLVVISTELVVILRDVIAGVWATSRFFAVLAVTGGRVNKALAKSNELYEKLLGVISPAEQAAEELAKAQRQAGIDALLHADAIAKLNEQLAELATTYEGKLVDAQTKFQEGVEEAERRFAERLEDLERKRARDSIIRSIKLGQQLQDLWSDHQDKLGDITRKHTSRLAKIESKRDEQIATFRQKAQKQKEDLELKHQERLFKINTKFFDTVEEAARKNDAVAVVRAIRERNRAIRDAERTKAVENKTLDDKLVEQRRKIDDDFAKRKAEENQRVQEEIALANIRYAKQLEDLRIQKEREREIRKLHQQWEEEDLARAHARQLAELERTKAKQLAEIDDWYRQEREKLQANIAAQTAIAVNGINNFGVQAAQATTEAISRVTQAAMAAMSAGVETDRWRQQSRDITGQSASGRTSERWQHRQRGGIDVVNRPTHYVAGEGGAEVAAFMPLKSGAMNVSHSFGNLPVSFQGLPGGTNTAQAETMVYRAMQTIAERLIAGVKK